MVEGGCDGGGSLELVQTFATINADAGPGRGRSPALSPQGPKAGWTKVERVLSPAKGVST